MSQDISSDSEYITSWASSGIRVEASQATHEAGAAANTIANSSYYNNELYKFATSINRINRKGVADWSTLKTYAENDVVEHNNRLWVATSSSLNSEPTDINANWDRSLYRSEDAIVLRDGSKSLTGNWDVGTFDVTNIGSLSATNASITNITDNVNMSGNSISGVSTITATNGSFTNITSNVDFGSNSITGVDTFTATGVFSRFLTMTPEVPGTDQGGQIVMSQPDTGTLFNQPINFDISQDKVRFYSTDHNSTFKSAEVDFNNLTGTAELAHTHNHGIVSAYFAANTMGTSKTVQASYPVGTITMVYIASQGFQGGLSTISGSLLTGTANIAQNTATNATDLNYVPVSGSLPGSWKLHSDLQTTNIGAYSRACCFATRVS